MPPKVAAITMAYNEATLLPVWARHYARQVGADYCYVIDHGSTDAVVVPRGMNTVRLPRSPHDEVRRAAFVSDFAASLLGYYDWVLYTDVDELLLPDPARHANLQAFCADATEDMISAIGLDVQHLPGDEPALDPAAAIGPQRGWVRFTSALCKPALTRIPVRWNVGFHSADRPVVFGGLFLFHLHWADREIGRGRLARTRTMPWADTSFSSHMRMGDQDWLEMFDGMARLPQRVTDLLPGAPPLHSWLKTALDSRTGATGAMDLHVNAPELWPIPPRFRAALV